MIDIKSPTAQTAYLKIIELRHNGEVEFDVTITDNAQRKKFEREIRHLTNELSARPDRKCVIIKINNQQYHDE